MDATRLVMMELVGAHRAGIDAFRRVVRDTVFLLLIFCAASAVSVVGIVFLAVIQGSVIVVSLLVVHESSAMV